MTLRELLRLLREDVLHDRSDLVAGDEDKLWSDATLVRYLDEAERRFCRRSLCIRDGSTAAITQFLTVAYQDEYVLHPSILAVISTRFMGNGHFADGVYVINPGLPEDAILQPLDHADLARAGHSQFDGGNRPDRYFENPNYMSFLPPNKPLAYDTDEFTTANTSGSVGIINLRLYPKPSPDYGNCVVQMRVARLPQNHLKPDDLDASPEIPEEYHLYLLDWAAYLALRIVDHELGDPIRAAEFKKNFEDECDEARREMLRKMFTPNVWGFGRNGFSFVGN